MNRFGWLPTQKPETDNPEETYCTSNVMNDKVQALCMLRRGHKEPHHSPHSSVRWWDDGVVLYNGQERRDNAESTVA